MLMALSGHMSVQSLAKYVRVSAKALQRHQAERDSPRADDKRDYQLARHRDGACPGERRVRLVVRHHLPSLRPTRRRPYCSSPRVTV